MTDYMAFMSGSDIRGTAYSDRGGEIDLTDDVVARIAECYLLWLRKKLDKQYISIAVGRDSRISGQRIAKCVCDKLLALGACVTDCGLCSTPAMFMITVDKTLHVDASVQITASHHPYDKNGLKFFTSAGGLEACDIAEILTAASGKIACKDVENKRSLLKCNYMKKYADTLVDFVRKKTGEKRPLKGSRIVVDAGGGVGGFYADKVLRPLGANTDGSKFLEPDGYFQGHIPNPENPEAMRSVCDAVRSSGADFGIIFDTDVDRAGAVDGSGNGINRNRLIALVSAILLDEKSPAAIVTDSVTSDGLHAFIEARGGVHIRYKRGYKNVINECKRLNEVGTYSPLAIETSGHAAFAENYYLDDGAYLITRLLVRFAEEKRKGKTLTDLIADLKQPAEECEIRLSFGAVDFQKAAGDILVGLETFARSGQGMTLDEDGAEGVRIRFGRDLGEGFALIRTSVHDPIMPINIESDVSGGVQKIAEILYGELKKYDGLNLENLAAKIK